MSKILELRRKRAEINAQIQALATVENTDGQLSAEQLTQFDTLSAEFNQLGEQLARLESAEQMAAATAQQASSMGNRSAAVHVKEEAKQYVGAKAARFAMSVAAGGGDMNLAAKFARNEIRDSEVAMAIETSTGSGGALIPVNIQEEVIELLRSRTVVRKLGAQEVPLPNGNMSMPKMSAGAQSSYVGEGNDALATGAEIGDVKLNAKTMITLVPMSNQLIGFAGPKVERIILGDILASMQVREDKAFLRDDGTNDTPIGFKKRATDAGRTLAWSGTAHLTDVDAYLDQLMLMVIQSDSMLISPGWTLSPRSWVFLQGLRDGNGNKVYPEMAQGLLKGYPIYHTTTVPVNLGAGTNQSEIYFADWNDVVIGEMDNMTMDFSREATYLDSNGVMVSAYARNQSLIRVVANHDVGFRHATGLALGTAITW